MAAEDVWEKSCSYRPWRGLTELKKPQDTAHARIYDRLLELCTPIACTGPSMRKDIGQAKLNLLKTLLA